MWVSDNPNPEIRGVFCLHWSLVPIVLYLALYYMMDAFAAVIMTLCIALWYLLASMYVYYVQPQPVGTGVAVGIHVVAWVFQFLGHGVWEKRKPALFDSLIQAFLMAPFFVLLEVLFSCGYNRKLQKQIEDRAQYFIAGFEENQLDGEYPEAIVGRSPYEKTPILKKTTDPINISGRSSYQREENARSYT